MALMQPELWDVYDIHGQHTNRTIRRGQPLAAGEYHRVVHIWVRNPAGAYLIQQRSPDLTIQPGVWATTGGSVLAGENSRQGAMRELAEELGIVVDDDALEMLFELPSGNALCTAWLLERDVPLEDITIQQEEVSRVMWATPQAIRQLLAQQSFYDYGSDYFALMFPGQDDEPGDAHHEKTPRHA